MWLSAVLGCDEPDPPRTLVVVARQDDGTYALEPRDRGDLRDPRRLIGPLGHGWRGGRFDDSSYRPGGELDIRWTTDRGQAVPIDDQGLVLWSFWADLDDARQALEDRGWDVSPIFPIAIAWTPQSSLDLSAAENAAYVLGRNTFILFPDALDDVPLAANAGVVRHEFGHAFFELLTTGKSGGDIPWTSEELSTQLAVRALNEGFADMNATLGLDDPRFIDASLPQPDRDVSGDSVATDDKFPPPDAGLLDAIGGYDPYALGTVFASFAWDVRLATDPDTAFALAVSAATDYGQSGDWRHITGFVNYFLDHATGDALTAGCASAVTRFPGIDVSAECSP